MHKTNKTMHKNAHYTKINVLYPKVMFMKMDIGFIRF